MRIFHRRSTIWALALALPIAAWAQLADSSQAPGSAPGRTEPAWFQCSVQPKPKIPQEAFARGISGVVVADMQFLDGVLQEVTIVSGPEVYHQAVKDALMKYKCRGSPGKVQARQSFTFAIDRAPPPGF